MIYLIGGSSRAGKSILSKKLSKKLNFSLISTDIFRTVIIPYFSSEEKKVYFPFEKKCGHKGVEKYFKNYSKSEILKVEKTESKTIWPGIKNLIKYLHIRNMDYIIEGVHLLPHLLKQFKDEKNIKILYLIKVDRDKIYNGLIANRKNGDWVSQKIKDDDILKKTAESFSNYGQFILKETKKYRMKYINTENNFFDKIDSALKYLLY